MLTIYDFMTNLSVKDRLGLYITFFILNLDCNGTR